ncbi:MAG: hypothetical protein AB7J32_04850 [Pseudonocardia sp.]
MPVQGHHTGIGQLRRYPGLPAEPLAVLLVLRHAFPLAALLDTDG